MKLSMTTLPRSEQDLDESLPLLDRRSESRHEIHKKLFEEMDIARKGRVSKIDFAYFLKDLNLAQEVTDRIWIDMHMADKSEHHHMHLTEHEMNYLTFPQFSGYLEELEHSATFWDMVTGREHLKYEFWANVLLVLATFGEFMYKIVEMQPYEILTSFTEFLSACLLMNMTIRVVDKELGRHRVDLEIIENHCKPHRIQWTRSHPLYTPVADPERLEKMIHVLEAMRSNTSTDRNMWLPTDIMETVSAVATTPQYLDPRSINRSQSRTYTDSEEKAS